MPSTGDRQLEPEQRHWHPNCDPLPFLSSVLADSLLIRKTRDRWSKEPPMHRKGNQGPERRLREVGAQWSEVTDPLTHTCLHSMSQKERATPKLPLPFLVALSQNAKIITRPSSSACFSGRRSGQLAGKVEPQSPDSLSAPITRSNLGRACFSWSQEERLQKKTTGKFSPLTRRQQLRYCVRRERLWDPPKGSWGFWALQVPGPPPLSIFGKAIIHLWRLQMLPGHRYLSVTVDNPFRSPDTST